MAEHGSTSVPRSVLDAWGLDGEAEPLDGGQGTSVRAGDLVLKPQADEAYVSWHAGLCSRVSSRGFRLPAPVPARDGRLVVDGWSATTHVVGHHVRDDDTSVTSWLSLLAASRAFHEALADESRPAFLDARTDQWARADRVAWNVLDVEATDPLSRASESDPEDVGPRSSPLLKQMRDLVHDEGLPSQLVHGDLSGNVLFADGLPPAVIDISPYWRPAAFADAVVVVDALLWWWVDPVLVDDGRPEHISSAQWRSLLSRALVFRLLAFDEPRRDARDIDDEIPRYAAVLSLLARFC